MNELETLLADLVSEDDQRAEAAAPHLAALGGRVLQSLQRLLDSEVIDHRWWAIRVLSQMEKPPLEWLWKGLQDPNPEIRQGSALALTYHPDERSIPLLVAALNDTDRMTVILSTNALIALGSPAVPALIEAEEDSSISARIEIIRALAAIRDQRAISVLMRALNTESALLNYHAEHGLDLLGLDLLLFNPK